MKNLLVYLSAEKKFLGETEDLIKVQIDNSLELGWTAEDFLLVNNFDYEYNGIRSIVVDDSHRCSVRPRSTNTTILPYLIDQGLFDDDEIVWLHDADAYQLEKITDEELQLADYDMGLTDYGWKDRWCMGSFFFKNNSKDILLRAKEIVETDVEDEDAMLYLMNDPEVVKRCKRMNITYNFGMRHVEENFERASKPLKVVHFHPYYKWVPTLDIFMYGKNDLEMPLITGRFKKILNKHGIK